VPERLPDLAQVDVWIGAGNLDAIIPPSETQRLVELLRNARARVTPSFADAGHGLTNTDVEAARLWLAELVNGLR